MKELAMQKSSRGFWVPYSLDDQDISSEFKPNQICRVKVYGFKKERSLPQLNTFWACCQLVADNTEDQNWITREKVAMQVKVNLQFVDLNRSIVDSHGVFHSFYRSIAIKNLPHMESCRFFDRAFEVLAKKLGITVDKLIEEAKLRMNNGRKQP